MIRPHARHHRPAAQLRARLQSAAGKSSIAQCWNAKTPLQRLGLVMRHIDLFWAVGLVSGEEIKIAESLSEGNLEYIIQREEQPLFRNIGLKQKFASQPQRQKMKLALKACFPSQLG